MKRKNILRHVSAITAIIMSLTLLAACEDDKPSGGAASAAPKEEPTISVTSEPTEVPSEIPTEQATEVPTEVPTEIPTEVPTEAPTTVPDDAMTPHDFVGLFEGTWTSEDGEFIDIGEDDGTCYVLFAIWNAGGDFPVGHVSSVTTVNETEYNVHMSMNFGGEADFVLKVVSKDTVSFGEAGKASKQYVFYPWKQFPVTALYYDPVQFAVEFTGFWTETIEKNEKIQILNDSGTAKIFMGVWSSEISEEGEILSVTAEDDGITFNLEVRWQGIPGTECPEHTEYYRLVKKSDDEIDMYYTGNDTPYSYYLDTDSHSSVPDITKAAAMTEQGIIEYIGDYNGRYIAELWKDYIVNDDDIFITYKDPATGTMFKCLYTDDYILVMVQFL